MPTETLADGTTATWTGQNICFCVTCKLLFNSVTAFDAHLRYPKSGGQAKHDVSRLFVNAKGYYVTKLREGDDGQSF